MLCLISVTDGIIFITRTIIRNFVYVVEKKKKKKKNGRRNSLVTDFSK